MQNILITLSASPYGSERVLTSLRLTLALASHNNHPRLRLFLLSDAVITAMQGQAASANPSLGEMLQEAISMGVETYVCRTCADARGLSENRLIQGVKIGTMPELASWTLEADKVLGF